MEDRRYYNYSVNYEVFLARAFKYDSRLSQPSNRELLNLIDAENGKEYSFLPSKERQFDAVKSRVLRAITIFLNKEKSNEHVQGLRSLLPMLEAATKSNDIIEIVELGLKYSSKFIND